MLELNKEKNNLNTTMTEKIAKPFLKWAGGKTQLINDFEKSLPKNITKGKFTYIEPFVGSGAILFWVLNNYPNLKKAVINDNFFNEIYAEFYISRVKDKKSILTIAYTKAA